MAKIQDAYHSGREPEGLKFVKTYSQEFVTQIQAIKFSEEERELIEKAAERVCTSQEHWQGMGIKRCNLQPQLNYVELSKIDDDNREPLNLLFGGPFSIDREFAMSMIVVIGCERGVEFDDLLEDIGAEPITEKGWFDWTTENNQVHAINEGNEDEMWSRFYRLSFPVNPLRGQKFTHEADLNLRTNLRIKKGDIQHRVLGLPTPLLIEGKAGSGKSSLLYARLAWSMMHHCGRADRAKLLYITYSPYLAQQAKITANAAINTIHEKTMENYRIEIQDVKNCDFYAFRQFLLHLLPYNDKIEFKNITEKK